MFQNRWYRSWFLVAFSLWLVLFPLVSSLDFLIEHWYYPAIMVLGGFVAGSTPEGGGAVAFPILNVFLQIERTMARDFSLMIQSIGMTSASIFILGASSNRRNYAALLWMIPIASVGFVFGMQFLQQLPVFIIQALFLSLITAFAGVYSIASHRGCQSELRTITAHDWPFMVAILLVGGMFASLFGTGADIVLYAFLVTWFRLQEKIATHMAIMLMAALSIFGFAYRALFDGDVTHYQFQTWLSAYPVVLVMAPLGALILSKINKEYMLRGIAVLNVAQLAYFLLFKPSIDKLLWASFFMLILTILFSISLQRLSQTKSTFQNASSF